MATTIVTPTEYHGQANVQQPRTSGETTLPKAQKVQRGFIYASLIFTHTYKKHLHPIKNHTRGHLTLVSTARTRGALSALKRFSVSGVSPPSRKCQPRTAPVQNVPLFQTWVAAITCRSVHLTSQAHRPLMTDRELNLTGQSHFSRNVVSS